MTEFQGALTHFLTLHVETNAEGVARALLPPVVPAEGVSPGAISEASTKVARAAGRAAAAPELTGMKIAVDGRLVDPVMAWRTITLPKPMLEPGDVLDAVEQMLGRLEAMTWKAEAELPSTTGVLLVVPEQDAVIPEGVTALLRTALATRADFSDLRLAGAGHQLGIWLADQPQARSDIISTLLRPRPSAHVLETEPQSTRFPADLPSA